MIQASHLTAWQAHAPWPKRSQIEQDLRISRGVAAIFADPDLRAHLAMRGGTVLHKAHLAPAARYSYDINEMLGTKTRALLQREQGRDLFDLFHAWQLSEAGKTRYRVDGAKAMAALVGYLKGENRRLRRSEANAKLDQHLRNPAFRRDMDTLLRRELGRFDVEEAAVVVRAAYFEYLEP